MSIVKTITDDYYFWNWLKKSDSYSSNFTLDGAKAVQAYFEEFSEQTDEGVIEFDPIAWCVTFSEYDNLNEFNVQYWGEGKQPDAFTLEELQNETTVIELEKGRLIVEDF